MHLHLTDDDLVLHYYGEMPAPGESEGQGPSGNGAARVESHLAACAACQANYTKLQRVMAFVDSAPAVEAEPGFERTAWARLEPALPRPERGWLRWFLFSPARLAFTAGVLLLIGAAFVAGRVTRAPAGIPGGQGQQAAVEKVRERILLVDLGEHLDRSQMVLVELTSADDSKGDVDISMEQSRAEQLVAANRLYRQTALSTGDAAMASVLDELERVLVDIAASPSTVSQQDLDMVRRRIESKELLFKVRVVSSQVRERQKAAIQERTTQATTLGS
jgi:anti-sigma factor RsiW